MISSKIIKKILSGMLSVGRSLCLHAATYGTVDLYLHQINNMLQNKQPDSINTFLASVSDEKRTGLARELLKQKLYVIAYNVLASHRVNKTHDFYTEIEFLSGFVAYVFLQDAPRATAHFFNMANSATISRQKSKAAYWLGIALQKQGCISDTLFWLSVAAQFPQTFYGQLSQIYLKRTFAARPERVQYQTALCKNFHTTDVLAQWLQSFTFSLLDPRFSHPQDFVWPNYRIGVVRAALPQLFSYVNPGIALQVYMKFFKDYVPLKVEDYPILSRFVDQKHLNILYSAVSDKPTINKFVEVLVHAIILNESRFDSNAHSHAGAQGIMQLMPKTAKKEFDKFTANKLVSARTSYDVYAALDNIVLGVSHLQTLISKFGLNIILIAAAYNAGEKNVRQWISIFGDPRTGSATHWIELIPFKETRLYVQRVISAFIVYTRVLDGEHTQDFVWPLFRS